VTAEIRLRPLALPLCFAEHIVGHDKSREAIGEGIDAAARSVDLAAFGPDDVEAAVDVGSDERVKVGMGQSEGAEVIRVSYLGGLSIYVIAFRRWPARYSEQNAYIPA